MLNIHVCYPVWKFAGDADPFRTAMDAITRGGYEPEYEAALIQSVFDMAHAARYRAEDEDRQEPKFHGPVYTVDYEEVPDSEDQKKDEGN